LLTCGPAARLLGAIPAVGLRTVRRRLQSIDDEPRDLGGSSVSAGGPTGL